jgi:hypothetical protein
VIPFLALLFSLPLFSPVSADICAPHCRIQLRKSICDVRDWFWTPSDKEREEIERRKRLAAISKEDKDP